MSYLLLKVYDLYVYYGVIYVLKGIFFEVECGEIVFLIGVNGVGKISILRVFLGLVDVCGLIELDG